MDYDVCLMFTKLPFDIDGKVVSTIELGDSASCKVGDMCVASGFGLTDVTYFCIVSKRMDHSYTK